MVLFRFAPSPTGYLHVGNARVAVINYLFAKSLDGQFMLRLDDTDLARNRPEYEQGIYRDLAWLGIEHDQFARQSDRMDSYEAARVKLFEMGRLYPCFESEEELSLLRKTKLARGLPPVYDRSALKLSKDEVMAKIANGEAHHWRFLLTDKPIAFDDLVRGHVEFSPGHLSDPVLIREDGRVLYTLSSVVDDGELAATHIVRGEDHVTNTAMQVELFEALGFNVPIFAHMPLMCAADGSKISKRIGGLSLAELREEGFEAKAIVAQLARLGTNEAANGAETWQDLIKSFDISAFGRAAPRFDPEQLQGINHNALASYEFEDVSDRLQGSSVDQAIWLAVRGNISKLDDVKPWADICLLPLKPFDFNDEDKAYLKQAADLLPLKEAWPKDNLNGNDSLYDDWIQAIKKASGRKGKSLFLPLRLALTGLDHGPQMQALLPIIGYDRTIARLSL